MQCLTGNKEQVEKGSGRIGLGGITHTKGEGCLAVADGQTWIGKLLILVGTNSNVDIRADIVAGGVAKAVRNFSDVVASSNARIQVALAVVAADKLRFKGTVGENTADGIDVDSQLV